MNEGKTTLMKKIHREKGGAGIVSEKIFDDGVHTGYRIRFLGTDRTADLARLYTLRNLPGNFHRGPRLGQWLFSADAFRLAGEVFTEILKTADGPWFLDEIGRLEFDGGGFAGLLREAAASGRDGYITCRTEFTGTLLKEFGLTGFSFIPVGEEL
jgi:nucleoside-triphosphatase THEP1